LVNNGQQKNITTGILLSRTRGEEKETTTATTITSTAAAGLVAAKTTKLFSNFF